MASITKAEECAQCLPDCQVTKYDIHFVQRSYNTTDVDIAIYLEDIAYTAINQEPAYPAMSLFGEIGGMLGLFVGSSILTIIEVLDLVIVYLIQVFKN